MSNNNPNDLPGSPKRLTSDVKAGGCAAKLGASELKQLLRNMPKSKDNLLLTGHENFEDAAVYKLREDLAVVETVDFFPPMVDDPFLFGQIAATNALSDIYAMGAQPVLALALLSFPTCDFALEVAAEILKGGADQVTKAGAMIAGGHSINGQEVLYGLTVTGVVHPSRMLTNSGARPGDYLLMTRALGTGVSLLALKAGLLDAELKARLFGSLTTLNDMAVRCLSELPVHACTDITGFGLIGHIQEMSKASKLSCKLDISGLRFLPHVLDFARQGLVPAGAYNNRKSFQSNVSYIKDFPLEFVDLLYDPQTAGGLLLALDEDHWQKAQSTLEKNGVETQMIGRFVEGIPGHIDVFTSQ